MIHQHPEVAGAGKIDLKFRAIATENRPVRCRIEIVHVAAHIRYRPATEQPDIDPALVVAVDQHRVRIRRLRQDRVIKAAQDGPAFYLDESMRLKRFSTL